MYLPKVLAEQDAAREREVLGQAAHDDQVVGADRLIRAGIDGVGVREIAHGFRSFAR